jgi:hypothetical protein
MAKTAYAVLESALQERKLDRTLTTALSPGRTDPSALAPLDIAALDSCLRGGLPRGQLSELAGPDSSGRMTLLLQLMAAATRRSELVALVDTFDRLDVASVVATGVDLDRLLWIRGIDTQGSALRAYDATSRAEERLLDRTIDRALKAVNLVLQAGGFGVVALDLAEASPAALTQIPYTTWPRVQRVIEGSDTACVLLTPHALARSAGGLTLSLAGQSTWTGTSDSSRRLTGAHVAVRVVSPRRRVDGSVTVETRALDSHG